MCPLWTKISFVCAQGFTFALLFYFSFIYALFVSKQTVWYEFVVQWINTYSTRGKIIWSYIFQPCDLVRHFPGPAFSALRFGPSLSGSCIFQPCDLVRHIPGPAFSSLAIWSVIFQVLHFPGFAFSVAPRRLQFDAFSCCNWLRIGVDFSCFSGPFTSVCINEMPVAFDLGIYLCNF